MPRDKKVTNKSKSSFQGFSDVERAAMQDRIKELNKDNGEAAVLAKIAEMPIPERTMAQRIHAIVKETAPDLTPKTWYGMPAYANNDGKVICYFKPGYKYKMRYSEFGFIDTAHLDDGTMWPIGFALTKLTESDEKKIATLLKKAVS